MAEGVQSGPERSRARSLRPSEPLTARTALSPFRQEGKGQSLPIFVFPQLLLRAPTNPVATLPSALFVSDFCFARCKLGVLVSAGAATCLSTSRSISRWKLGQAIDAVTGTRHLGAVLPIRRI